jgi:hypothetical protein
MLTYAGLYSGISVSDEEMKGNARCVNPLKQVLTYADVCWRMLAYADVC